MTRRRKDLNTGKIARRMFQAEGTAYSKALGRNYKKDIMVREDCGR